MGVFGSRPEEVDDFLEEAREEGIPWSGIWAGGCPVRSPGASGGWSECFRPVFLRRGPPLFSALGPIFAAMGQPGLGPLNLVAVPAAEDARPRMAKWFVERREDGWRGSTPLRFPGAGIWLGRPWPSPVPSIWWPGGLSPFSWTSFFFWRFGEWAGPWPGGGKWTRRKPCGSLGSFRARVTLALFGFFFLSIAIFGTLAFQTLSGAAERTASALAERLVEDGASGYLDVAGQMEILAQEVGADLLEYRNGELIDGSAEELVELGLYEGWVPEPHLPGPGGPDRRSGGPTGPPWPGGPTSWPTAAFPTETSWPPRCRWRPEPRPFGGRKWRISSVSPSSLGAALSLALAFLVGGTLTRPIETLQIASERVGCGESEGTAPR